MLENNTDFPRLLTHPSGQIQADLSFVEPKIWLFLKLTLIQELLQEFFSFVTNRTKHRANGKAAENCIFDIKILLWFNVYQWGSLCPASCLKFHENGNSSSDLSCSAPRSKFLFALTEMSGSETLHWIRDYQKGIGVKSWLKEFRKPRVLLNHHRHPPNFRCLLPHFLSGGRKCQWETWLLQGTGIAQTLNQQSPNPTQFCACSMWPHTLPTWWLWTVQRLLSEIFLED